MAVGKLFNTLTFGGVNSGDYDVYITGAGVYDAPARDVEMVTIPGRNGQYAVDQGRFEQIEVTYPAAVAKKSAADFASTIREFRNALASQIGYQRLEDDYNPAEFRLGVFSSGIEVKPNFKRTGEFDITFSCQPQRFLKGGEQDIVLAGHTASINNPYPYTAHPLYKLYGTGAVKIGDDFEIANTADPIGELHLAGTQTISKGRVNLQYMDKMNSGDPIYIARNEVSATTTANTEKWIKSVTLLTTSDGWTATVTGEGTQTLTIRVENKTKQLDYEAYIASSQMARVEFRITYSDDTTKVDIYYLRVRYGGGSYMYIEPELPGETWDLTNSIYIKGVTGTSSKSSLGEPLYIDSDIGEAYTITDDGEYVSQNMWARIGASLPVLPPGVTAIDCDDTVRELRVEPRWWIV